MNVKCSYCPRSFNLGYDFMVTAVQTATEKQQKHLSVDCPHCRKAVKVQVALMKRAVDAVKPAASDTVSPEN